MKRLFVVICCLILTLSCLAFFGCETSGKQPDPEQQQQENPIEKDDDDGEKEQEPESIYYTVTFNTDGGSVIENQKVKAGEKAVKPKEPKKQSTETEDYIFNGWVSDGKEWDFDTDTVNKDIEIKAVYKVEKNSKQYLPSE